MDKACRYDQGDECRILSEKFCPGCRFYKTQREYLKQIAKNEDRLNALPPEHQANIAEKYYKNQIPWRTKKGGRNHGKNESKPAETV